MILFTVTFVTKCHLLPFAKVGQYYVLLIVWFYTKNEELPASLWEIHRQEDMPNV